mmetsp:Transcript_2681/g.8617  ORF Transcript_2681/g.8617 Transcript_2681/m.8617 type:complete len:217 (-) Transcript_2681:78-728(-)
MIMRKRCRWSFGTFRRAGPWQPTEPRKVIVAATRRAVALTIGSSRRQAKRRLPLLLTDQPRPVPPPSATSLSYTRHVTSCRCLSFHRHASSSQPPRCCVPTRRPSHSRRTSTPLASLSSSCSRCRRRALPCRTRRRPPPLHRSLWHIRPVPPCPRHRPEKMYAQPSWRAASYACRRQSWLTGGRAIRHCSALPGRAWHPTRQKDRRRACLRCALQS